MRGAGAPYSTSRPPNFSQMRFLVGLRPSWGRGMHLGLPRNVPRMDERRLTRLAAERRLFVPGPSGGLSVCLVYPNTYPVAMANLGFQAVLRLLSEDPRGACDRAFLADGERAAWPRTLRSFRQDRSVGDFDVAAFPIPSGRDYL